MECLQETNRALEEKLQGLQFKKKNVSTEVATLSLKNLELCEELTHIDQLAKQMEIDKDRVLETVDIELQDAKVRQEGKKCQQEQGLQPLGDTTNDINYIHLTKQKLRH